MDRIRKEKPMSNLEVVRAWKDTTYRMGLSPAELAMLPEHPSGSVELTGMKLYAEGRDPSTYDDTIDPYCSMLCMTYDPCAESTITTTTTTPIIVH